MIRQSLSFFRVALCLPFLIFADDSAPQEKQDTSVQEILSDGSQIRIDTTWYDVSPPHHQTARRWNDSSTHGHPRDCNISVINTQNGNLDYPIDIYNDCTRETIQVRYPKTVEEAPILEAPSENDESD